MSFSDAEEDQLINFVVKYPALYDTSHEKYLDCNAKDDLWRTLGQQLNKTIDDCKKQWKLIRNSYARFKKKNRLGSAALKKSKFKRHEQLKFLDSVQHRANGNVTPLVSNDIESINTDNQSDCDKHTVKKIKKKPNNDDISRRIIIRQQRDARRQHLMQTIQKKKDDDVDYFCRHIAEVLRNLPPLDKAKAKKHLSDVLSDYEILAATRSAHSDPLHTSSSVSNYSMSPSNLGTPCHSPETKYIPCQDQFIM